MARVVRKPGKGAEQLRIAIAALADKRGKVGFFESAKYKDGTPVAYVATIQEYGSPAQGIPPRPFMRPTVQREQKNWASSIKLDARSIITGKLNTQGMMERLTLLAAGNVAESIAAVKTPALKESTIKNRLRKREDGETVGNLDKPLVDSGVMINSVSNLVEDA